MFKQIVWATDGSENAERALSYARDLARREGAGITVVHVLTKLAGGRAGNLSVHGDEDEIKARIRAQFEDLLRTGVNATLTFDSDLGGNPAHQIADAAREARADLIVVGTRGHTVIGGLLLGSVTQRLLHEAPCPVLVVGQDEFKAAA
jgi:nucleotide-binding universal stress UspA family protein